MPGLEDKLIQTGWLTPQQLMSAKQEADRGKKSFWTALIKLNLLSPDDLCVFFAQESGIPYVRIADYKINQDILELINDDFCRQNLIFPLFKINSTLFVACANPLDTALIDSLARLYGLEIEPLASPADAILKALDFYYGPEDKIFEFEKFIAKQPPLAGLPFWRESERLPLNIPVNIDIRDTSLVSPCSLSIHSHSRDISKNGTALGLEILLFLPRGLNICLEFLPPDSPAIKTEGEIVYCRMEKCQQYFIGIRFTKITKNDQEHLFKLAKRSLKNS